ncbi:Uncharacterized conserved protein, DUF1015 family [Picrophilus oshimae DSM 9789]|uniref:Uncharacterized conserved protein, DUF1015 family n=1 Tax=Picrophilus torridus (strain ATCC 700027 / DSM 9790 / JCM 10055 / NBRC 100828 / KAW 2/3) TaxID=1122961 RepID=A0A8G2L8C0_PICTO|nr:Uncharacterized conserved protein, DUF1015 family [Picrophilus oshimae DSM 9789]
MVIILRIESFKPYIFNVDISRVVSPPFDTLNWTQEYELRQNPYNIINLTVPDMVTGTSGSYKILKNWLSENVIKRYDKDIIIIIKQIFTHNKERFQRYGIISLANIMDITPHEMTFKEYVDERMSVMESLNANLEPIFLVVNDGGFYRMIKREVVKLNEVYRFEEPSGVTNIVYFLEDEEKIDKIKKSLENAGCVVADGHHRLQAARNLYDKTHDEFWLNTLAYITSIYDDGLMIGGVHRLIKSNATIESLSGCMNLEPSKTIENGRSYLYNGSLYSINTKDMIPVEFTNDIIIKKCLEMDYNDMLRNVGYAYDVSQAISNVDSKKYDFAIIVPEWKREDFIKISMEKRMLPQKSTYFYPKIPSGIVIHLKPL